MAWYADMDKMARAAGTRESWHGEESVIAGESSMSQWRAASGLDFTVAKESLFRKRFDGAYQELTERVGLFRTDNPTNVTQFDGELLGSFTDGYQVVQPSQVAAFFEDFILQDERFAMDTMGALKGGKVIWALAKFKESMEVAGSAHAMYALLSTSFDGTSATRGGSVVERVVCRNTLKNAAHEKGIVKIKHNQAFDRVKQADAIRDMAAIAAQFTEYKGIAEALAGVTIGFDATMEFLGNLVGVPKDANALDTKQVPTKRRNTLVDLADSLSITLREPGTDAYTGWTALNAVTRFVDHARPTRGSDSASEGRLLSSQFGSGNNMKIDAMSRLRELCNVPDLIAA